MKSQFKTNILICEDESVIGLDLKLVLVEKGYKVAGVVDNAASALKILENDKVDVLICDIEIKGDKNGFELARAVIDNYNCPVIFCTGINNVLFLKELQNFKNCSLILKPYEEKKLFAAIESCIKQ